MAYPLRSALFALDAERAHRAAIRALALWGSLGTVFRSEMVETPVQLGGLTFPNRLGLAAGLDKDAEAIPGLFGLGFGAVEVGTLTPRPQGGNPRPRLFRLPEDEAVINRMGFNNGGIDAALARIARLGPRRGMLGINVGANKDSADRVADYALGVGKAAAHADYVTINVSSPNTPGLRDLQSRPALDELLDNRIDALIVSNTTISRPPLRSAHAGETGGLSGKPLAPLARQKLAEAAEIAAGALPLISVGGIDGPDEARRRIDAGATLVQLYSALVFKGPGLPRAIARALR
ncbi:MAG: dihydroorotate dehydrogenase (quinone) [Proteobacteria bacterium]|nr:dihydroorotate dehydrogenase (quinone) [Pseudomonadota bacterium]